jgi:hypothetical protein
MTKAAHDLYAFIYGAIYGLCNHQNKISIEVEESGEYITLFIYCDKRDTKFISPKIREIKCIAIGIAQKNKRFVRISLEEVPTKSDYTEELLQ